MSVLVIETPRLRLRGWRDDDRAPFAAINADPRVMQHFTSTLSRDESDALVDRIKAGFAINGFGLWCVERRDEPSGCIGFIGLSVPRVNLPCSPCVEIAWRLASSQQRKGLATEGARAVVDAAWKHFGLEALVSFTVVDNVASRRVMEKLTMTRDPAEDFEHPSLPSGHPLRPHVLYRLRRPGFRAPD